MLRITTYTNAMKFTTLLLAASAAPLALACPVGRPSRTTTVVVTVTPGPSVVPVPPNVPAPAPAPVETSTKKDVTTPKQTSAPAPPPAKDDDEETTPGPATGPSVSGKSTFYGGNVAGGTCSFTGYTIPAGLYGTAFSGSAWNSAANCGACVKVTGPNGNSITAMVSWTPTPAARFLVPDD